MVTDLETDTTVEGTTLEADVALAVGTFLDATESVTPFGPCTVSARGIGEALREVVNERGVDAYAAAHQYIQTETPWREVSVGDVPIAYTRSMMNTFGYGLRK